MDSVTEDKTVWHSDLKTSSGGSTDMPKSTSETKIGKTSTSMAEPELPPIELQWDVLGRQIRQTGSSERTTEFGPRRY